MNRFTEEHVENAAFKWLSRFGARAAYAWRFSGHATAKSQ